MIAKLAKGLFDVEVIDIQEKIIKELLESEYPGNFLVMPDGSGKNYLLALYSILRCLTNRNHKIAITAAGFRYVKKVMEHIYSILNKCPSTSYICSIENGTTWKFEFENGSKIVGIPIGDGSKTRGQRANEVIFVGVSMIPRDILETIISGFSVVSMSPLEVPMGIKSKIKNKIVFSDTTEGLSDYFIEHYKGANEINWIEVSREDFPEGWFTKP